MALIDDAFGLLLKRITPPASQLATAQRAHNALRDRLDSDRYYGRLIETSFLNGSYARNTAIRPIADVDIVVVVGEEWMEEAPARAMESLRRKLVQFYGEGVTRRQRRAVKVQLSNIDLDVLMAVAPSGLGEALRIPDREANEWIETHPKRQLELIKELGSTTGGNYSRLVRLVKTWAQIKVPDWARPGSFLIECAVYGVISKAPAGFTGSLDEAFPRVLAALRERDFGRKDFLAWTTREWLTLRCRD